MIDERDEIPVVVTPQAPREPAQRAVGGEPVKVVDRRWWARDEPGDASEAWESSKPTYVEELERKLTEKEAQLQDYIARYRAATSEFDAARARLRRDIARDVERGRRVILADLLEVLDNLDRALGAPRDSQSLEGLLQGVELVRRLFLTKLDALNVLRVDALQQPFDPVRHEAVSTVPAADPSQDGRVVAVLTPGYAIGDEILRPASVVVATMGAPDEGPSE